MPFSGQRHIDVNGHLTLTQVWDMDSHCLGYDDPNRYVLQKPETGRSVLSAIFKKTSIGYDALLLLDCQHYKSAHAETKEAIARLVLTQFPVRCKKCETGRQSA